MQKIQYLCGLEAIFFLQNLPLVVTDLSREGKDPFLPVEFLLKLCRIDIRLQDIYNTTYGISHWQAYGQKVAISIRH